MTSLPVTWRYLSCFSRNLQVLWCICFIVSIRSYMSDRLKMVSLDLLEPFILRARLAIRFVFSSVNRYKLWLSWNVNSFLPTSLDGIRGFGDFLRELLTSVLSCRSHVTSGCFLSGQLRFSSTGRLFFDLDLVGVVTEAACFGRSEHGGIRAVTRAI